MKLIKRVGIITSSIDEKKLSGPALCQRKLISGIIKTKDPEIELFLIHFKENKDNIYTQANEIICKRSLVDVNKKIKNLNLDIVHINHITYKWFAFYFLPVKKIITIHGDASFVLDKKYLKGGDIFSKNISKIFSKIGLLKKVDRFITVSHSTSKIIQKNLKIPEEKISVIYNGIDEKMSSVENAKEKVSSEFGIDYPFILNVNNFAPKKNISTLVHAFALFKERTSSPMKLILVGNELRKNLVISKKIKNEIIFLNYINNDDLPLLYSAAEIFVNPTLHETFGVPNLEAMACGCPVITSNVFAVPEVVGKMAVLINDPTDTNELYKKIKTVNDNKKLSSRLKKEGPSRAQLFSWNKSAKEIINIYKKI